MRRIVYIIIVGLLGDSSVLFAQQADSLLYYEPMEEGTHRFYFDDRYFLADRDCQFVAVERDAGYDPVTRTFNGTFVDYDSEGRVILTGQYVEGKKEGEFVAYHTSGNVKWAITYRNDMPIGKWMYYYPDGRPLYVVEYRQEGLYIRDYWDTRGRRRVSEGKGRFEVITKLDRYHEHGYEYVRRRGRVLDGKPHGVWTTQYVSDGQPVMDGGFEQFSKGRFVRGLDAYTDDLYRDSSRLAFLPIDPFIRAELLAGRPCNIDAYSGFLLYLREHLESHFENVDEVVYAQEVEYVLELSQEGAPKRVNAVQTFPSTRLGRVLTEAFQNVPFWFPSYANGEYIDDRLTIRAAVFPDVKDEKLRFFDVSIQREKGI